MKVRYKITTHNGIHDIREASEGQEYSGWIDSEDLKDIMALQLHAMQLTMKTQNKIRHLMNLRLWQNHG